MPVVEVWHQADKGGEGLGEGDVTLGRHCAQDAHDEWVEQVQKLGEFRRLVALDLLGEGVLSWLSLLHWDGLFLEYLLGHRFLSRYYYDLKCSCDTLILNGTEPTLALSSLLTSELSVLLYMSDVPCKDRRDSWFPC